MSTSLKFSKDLFVAQDGTPMNFNLTRCENVQVLQEYIEHGGGLVQQSLGPYTVILKDAAQDLSTVREESFQSDFIIQCCSQNKILPLAQFRCSSTSLFSADFNPNDILHHKISWQSAEKHHKKTSDDSESEKSISVDETRHALTRANGPKVMSKKRTEFTQLDRKKIVEYIVRTKSHNQVTGNDLWKRMEPEINHHTWQSLKGHFMKKIIPLIGTYNLSKDEINKFRSGMSTSSGSGMQHNSNWKKNIPYSSDEDNLILDYVSRHANSKTCLGGNEFWKEMQNNNNYINGRPWKGVRERYLKHLQHRKPSDETISECAEETAAESNIVESVPASSEGRNGEGTSMKPSSWQKRKLVTAVCQSPAEFSPTSGKRTGSFLVKKKFNNTEDKNFRKLIVFSDDEDDEGINSNLNPSGPSLQDSLRHPQSKEISTDEQIAPPPSVGTLEDEGVNRGVDPLSPAPICQQFIPSKLSGEADEGSCSAKSRSPHPESDSEWPSNFPPERVILYSAISEVPLSDSDTREDETSVTSDSDWSDNGLFWRGGVEFPDGMKVKRHPFAHLTAVKCNEGHQGRKGKPLEARSEEQYGTDNGDLSETEVQDYLEAKKRACPEVTSTNYEALASGTSRGAEVQSNFSEPIDMESQDFSQQISHPGLQGTHREEPPVINTCEKTVNEDSRKVGVRVTLDNKKDVGVTVAVQTDPVLVLPIGWRSLISTSNGGLPSLSSNLPTTLHDYCVSPKPANII